MINAIIIEAIQKIIMDKLFLRLNINDINESKNDNKR